MQEEGRYELAVFEDIRKKRILASYWLE